MGPLKSHRFSKKNVYTYIHILEENPPAKAGIVPARSARPGRLGPVGPARSARTILRTGLDTTLATTLGTGLGSAREPPIPIYE